MSRFSAPAHILDPVSFISLSRVVVPSNLCLGTRRTFSSGQETFHPLFFFPCYPVLPFFFLFVTPSCCLPPRNFTPPLDGVPEPAGLLLIGCADPSTPLFLPHATVRLFRSDGVSTPFVPTAPTSLQAFFFL